ANAGFFEVVVPTGVQSCFGGNQGGSASLGRIGKRDGADLSDSKGRSDRRRSTPTTHVYAESRRACGSGQDDDGNRNSAEPTQTSFRKHGRRPKRSWTCVQKHHKP